jgi:hypothetical protein
MGLRSLTHVFRGVQPTFGISQPILYAFERAARQ